VPAPQLEERGPTDLGRGIGYFRVIRAGPGSAKFRIVTYALLSLPLSSYRMGETLTTRLAPPLAAYHAQRTPQRVRCFASSPAERAVLI